MNAQTLGWIRNLIWGIADDVLRDVSVRREAEWLLDEVPMNVEPDGEVVGAN